MCIRARSAEHRQPPWWPPGEDRRKRSAAWLIEQAGYKGRRDGHAGIAAQHALVLVNHGHASGAELWAFARQVQAAVLERFGVALEAEPRIV